MAKPFHLAGAAVMALLLCSAAGAQRGGTAPRMSARPAPVPVRSFSPGTTARSAPDSSNPRVIFSNGVNGQTAGVPGLGFDYPHLAAVSGNFRFNPPGTGVRHGGRRNAGTIVPIIWGGVPYYYNCLDPYNCTTTSGDQDAYAPVAAQAPAPQVIVIQQPVAAAAAPAPPASSSAEQSATPSAEPAPAQDNTGFVLIRRNGPVIFATAYSVIGSNIRYVTPEGVIRTVALADLDMDSSRSMNEARGVELSQIHQ